MERCRQVVKTENEKFYDEKLKNYEKFKNTSLDNKTGILKLKKILLLRTHSKKTKRRGRKRKIPYDEIINNDLDENNIIKIVNKTKDYEIFLSQIISYIISNNIMIEQIDWLKKDA